VHQSDTGGCRFDTLWAVDAQTGER
jgi:hypothetical protein